MIRYGILLTVVLALMVSESSKSSKWSKEVTQPSEATAGKAALGRVRVAGTLFEHPDGTLFTWRGITAFRLVELVASGRQSEAAAYLDWAAKHQVTVVRVLVMAKQLFALAPRDGRRALPALLKLAGDRGLHVEVVALADTAAYPVDLDAHVKAVGAIAAAHPNAFVEIANEPFHGTQHPSLHDRATLARLAALIPEEVVTAYGSEEPGSSGGGDYVTVHMPRGPEAWDHVLELAAGRRLVEEYGRPVVSDEPIGAAAEANAGRRDDSPERFRAAALLTRMTGMHATFHYEDGLEARVPTGVVRACFDAWREAWTLLPAGIERGIFRRLETPDGALFESRLGDQAWLLTLLGAPPPPAFTPVRAWPASALFVRKATD